MQQPESISVSRGKWDTHFTNVFRRWRGVGVLVGVVWLCHWPLLNAPFLADGEALALAARERARQGKLADYLAPRYWREEHGATKGLYRPVREIIFGWAALRWGLRPHIFHAVNLVLHSLNTLLIYWIGRELLRIDAAAFWGALIFSIHPAHVEAVAFAKNIAELLAAFCAAAGLAAFLRSSELVRHSWPRRAWLVVAVLSFALGLLAKETACTLPALLLLAIYSRSAAGEERRDALLATLPFWGVLFAYVLFYARFLLRDRPEIIPAAGESYLRVLATLSFYARFAWLPFPLAVEHKIAPEWGWAVVWQSLLVGTTLVALLFIAARWREGRLFLLWAPVTIGPVANMVFTAARLVGEQRLYWPSVGPCVLLGSAAWHALRRGRTQMGRYVASAAVVLLLFSFGGASFGRSWALRSGLVFARWELRHAPDDPMANHKFGKACSDNGLLPQALLHLEHAACGASRRDLRAHAFMELGTALGRAGYPQEAALWLNRAVELEPELAGAHESLGTALLQLGRPREATAHLARAMNLDPTRPGPLINLGQAHIELGNMDEAKRLLEQAIRLFPNDAQAHVAMGVLKSRQGDWPSAVFWLEKAAQLAPNRRATWLRLAAAYDAVGRHSEAQAAQERARQLTRGR